MASPSLSAQIISRMRSETPGHILYNPSDEWIDGQHNGVFYMIPPDGEGVDPMTGLEGSWDGTLVVKDRYGCSAEERRLAKAQGRKPELDIPVTTAHAIITHLIEQFAKRGLVYLSGTGVQDAKQRKDAKTKWVRFKLRVAEDCIQNYYKRSKAILENQPAGTLAPPMSDHEARMQEFLDDYKAGLIGRKDHICTCGYETDDAVKMARHTQRPGHTETVLKDAARKGLRQQASAVAAEADMPETDDIPREIETAGPKPGKGPTGRRSG